MGVNYKSIGQKAIGKFKTKVKVRYPFFERIY